MAGPPRPRPTLRHRLPPLGALLAGGWLSWERIARAWEAAQGSDEAIRAFRNTILGETWVETGEAPDWRRLYDRRERWPAGTVPEGGLILTAGADVQKDRIEVDVWAWGRGPGELARRSSRHRRRTGEAKRRGRRSRLCSAGTWPHALGAQLQIARLAVDTGYEAPAVYAWARAQGFAQVAPVKGVEGFNRASPVSGPTYVDATVAGKRLRRGARLWTVAVSTFKAETYRFLRLERPTDEEIAGGARMPPGTIHLPDWVETEWLKQFVAEQLVTVKTKRGFARLEWQKLRERNEALDTRVYARAAAWIAGLDRWSEERWAEAEREVGVERRRRRLVRDGGRTPTGSPDGWLGRRRGWLSGCEVGNASRRTDVGHPVATIRRHTMNWDQVQGSWKQFKGQVKQKWGDLTDDEIDRVEGRQEELAGLIQKQYGKTHEEAEREVDDWAGTL